MENKDYCEQSKFLMGDFRKMPEISERKSSDLKIILNSILDAKIANLFLKLGIPTKIKGYRYLRECIKIAVYDMNCMDKMSEQIYGVVADAFRISSAKNVERACSYAISLACDCGKMENINGLFDDVIVYRNRHDKPSVGEFIALIADKFRLELLN